MDRIFTGPIEQRRVIGCTFGQNKGAYFHRYVMHRTASLYLGTLTHMKYVR